MAKIVMPDGTLMEQIYEIDGVGLFTDRAEFEAAVKAHGDAHPEMRIEYAKKVEALLRALSMPVNPCVVAHR